MFIPRFSIPFLRFSTDGDSGSGGGGSEEPGFPADTPYEEMTPEQQLAFLENDRDKWKAMSKKHEKNRKPKSFDDDMAELTRLRDKQDDDLEPDAKVIKDAEKTARAAGRTEGITALLKPAVRAEFRARAPHLSEEELDEFLDDVEVTADKFYVDGALDTDRIDRLAKRIAVPAPDEDDKDDKSERRFNLGDITGRDSRGQKKGGGDPRKAAYERTKARFQPKPTN